MDECGLSPYEGAIAVRPDLELEIAAGLRREQIKRALSAPESAA